MGDPSKIMQVGMGFWASKTLLVAVRMGLFTELGNGPLDARAIQARLGLHERSLYDFLDALVALGFLDRSGLRETAVYANTEDTAQFLDRKKPGYIGGILEMADARLYHFWDRLGEGLKTGQPQNESWGTDIPFFEAIYSDEYHLRAFLEAMSGIQKGNFHAFAERFDFAPYKTLCDVGGAGGHLAMAIVQANPHIQATTLDLPRVADVAAENLSAAGLTDRVTVVGGDMFADDFPRADMVTMGLILHDWDLEKKKTLIRKAWEALPDGGAFAVIENTIDDERKENAFGLLMSLNMLIETDGGFDYSPADFTGWAIEAGFKRTEVLPLTGPSSAIIAYK